MYWVFRVGGRYWLVITYQETAVLSHPATVQVGPPPMRWLSKQFEAYAPPPSPHPAWAVARRLSMVISDIVIPIPCGWWLGY